MAIEMEIPKDITKTKKKFVGPLSFRQCIMVVPAVLLDWGAYKVMKGLEVSSDTMLPIMLLIMLPFLAFGWIELYGLPLEKFLAVSFKSTVLSPQKRLYKTHNYYQSAAVEFSPQFKKSKKKKASMKMYK